MEAEFQKKKCDLLEHLKSASDLTEKLEEEIIDVYGSRGKRAIAVIKNDGVREEDACWYVQGREEEYEIVGTQCTCYDYVLNVVTGKAGVDLCYHALAKVIFQLLHH